MVDEIVEVIEEILEVTKEILEVVEVTKEILETIIFIICSYVIITLCFSYSANQ